MTQNKMVQSGNKDIEERGRADKKKDWERNMR
jgi:hypothetical protein